MGRGGSPRRIRPYMACVSTTKNAPITAAVIPYTQLIPIGQRASEAKSVSHA